MCYTTWIDNIVLNSLSRLPKKNEKEKKKGGEVTDSEEGEGKEGSSWKRRLKMPYKIC